jgi:hypothetical protein
MWVVIQVHVLRFGEGRLYRVIAARLVGRIPVSDRRTSGDTQAIALFC